LGAGIVLTGGASQLPGTADLAERVLGLPVKIGLPIVKGGLVETVKSPMYATGVGLIQYALKRSTDSPESRAETFFAMVSRKVKELFEDFF
jgi:cell division protein FtsA